MIILKFSIESKVIELSDKSQLEPERENCHVKSGHVNTSVGILHRLEGDIITDQDHFPPISVNWKMSSDREDSLVDFSSSEMRVKRAKQACVNCKLHKVKCDGSVTEPCTQCLKKKIECVHSPPLKRGRKLKSEVSVGDTSSKLAPSLAPRNWPSYEPVHPTSTMSCYQARIQLFLDISQFYPFFSFHLDGVKILQV